MRAKRARDALSASSQTRMLEIGGFALLQGEYVRDRGFCAICKTENNAKPLMSGIRPGCKPRFPANKACKTVQNPRSLTSGKHKSTKPDGMKFLKNTSGQGILARSISNSGSPPHVVPVGSSHIITAPATAPMAMNRVRIFSSVFIYSIGISGCDTERGCPFWER